MDRSEVAGDHAAYLRGKRGASSVVLTKFRQRSIRVPNTLFCFLEGPIDYVAYRGAIDTHLPSANPYPIVCNGKSGVLGAFGRLVGERGDQLTNCLFFVDRDYDEFCGRSAPADWRLFVTDGYSFESDYAFGPGMKVLVGKVIAVHCDKAETQALVDRFERARDKFSTAIVPLLGVAVYCQSRGCRVEFDESSIESMFEFDDAGFPVRKPRALHVFLGRSLGAGSLDSIWAARSFIKILRCSPQRVAVRGKYGLSFLRIFLQRLMSSLQSEGVTFVRVDGGDRMIAQVLAPHIQLLGLAEFLDAAKGRLSVPC